MATEKVLFQVLYTSWNVPNFVGGGSIISPEGPYGGTEAILTATFTNTRIIATELQGDAKEYADKIWLKLGGGGLLSRFAIATGGLPNKLEKLFNELKSLPDNKQILTKNVNINMNYGKTDYGYRASDIYVPMEIDYRKVKKVVVSGPGIMSAGSCSVKFDCGLFRGLNRPMKFWAKDSLQDRIEELIKLTPLADKLVDNL
jgi:hypothetical protein